MKTEGTLSRARTRRVATTAAIAAGLAFVAPAALADDYDNGSFESFAYGTPLGQFGWKTNSLGGYDGAPFDIAVVDPSSAWGTELGTHALRLSNAATSGGFSNQLQTASLADAAGETTAVAGPTSGGVRQSRFSASFTFGSATKAYQPGLAVGFAPDRGDGARMSSFRITDDPSGLIVTLTVIDEADPQNFLPIVIASGLSHTELHTIQFSLDFVDGEANDVLWVSVDNSTCNSYAHSGSWEQFHRDVTDPPATFTADSLLFRLSGTAQPALLGGGLVIDAAHLTSSTVPAMPAPGVPTIAAAPTAAATAQHVDVSHPAVTTNACQPITGYTATLTPNGGGAPITLTSATPDFDFDAVPVGSYAVTLSATNSAGTSAPSAAAQVTVAAAVTATDPNPVGDAGDDELAATGSSSLPLAVAALGLVSLGFLTRRFANSRD